MNIGQIRYFAAVYQAGSFSRAAREQFITVQAVSKSIADLEHELGNELFERKSRGVEPTPFGKAFYCKAINALNSFDDLQAFATGQGSLQDSSTLRLALCAPSFKDDASVVANIRTLLIRHLNSPIELALTEGFKGMDLLRKGEVDALITIGSLDTPHTDCIPLLSAPTGVGLSVNHPLASQECVTLEQLSNYPVAVAQDFDYFNESILVTYLRAGLRSPLETIYRREDFQPFLEEKNGYAFSMVLPALEDDRFNSTLRLICPEDAIEIPICLVSSKFVKTPLYLAAERLLTGKLPFKV